MERLESRVLLSQAPAAPLANMALTSDPGVQQMPSIAADPSDPRHLVVSYMDRSLVNTGYAGIGVAVSRDGGATWASHAIPLPAGFAQGAADPATAFGANGNVFVSFMAAAFLGVKPALLDPQSSQRHDGFTSNNGVFVARSDDGGTTWGSAVAVMTNVYDGQHPVPFDIIPDLSIDSFVNLPDGQPNPNYGNAYVTWTQLYPAGQFPGDPTSTGGGTIMIAASGDGGRTWETRLQSQTGIAAPVTVIGATDQYFTGHAPPGLTGQNYAHSAIGPEGDVYVDYYLFGYFAIIHSTDAGRSFSSVNLQTSSGLPFNTGSLAGNISAGSAGGPTNHFRTLPVRDIIADPTRPGTVYVADSVEVDDSDGTPLDYGEIFFARSTDYGVTWQSSFEVGGRPAQVLNDDNAGQTSHGNPGDVAASQSMPRMAIDAQGNLAVTWYDTRHDPSGHLLDVYGTVSSDGGQTFSANFRVTDESFDANAGKFTDATGGTNFYLGDQIGLAAAGGSADAVWTDTRDGNQNVEFARFGVSPPPPAPADRFGPNDTPATAAHLGIVIDKDLPRLQVQAGGEEWFGLTAAVTGDLTISASPDTGPGDLTLELYRGDGSSLLASSSDASAGAATQQLTVAGMSGQAYLLRVATGANPRPVGYSLHLESLTANLGPTVVATEAGQIQTGDQAYYLLAPAAAGTLDANLTAGGDVQGALDVEILDPSALDADGNPVVLSSAQPAAAGAMETLTLPVTQGQPLLLHVSGVSGGSGHYWIDLTNLDLFASGPGVPLPFAAGNGPSQVVMADVNNDGKPDLVVSDALDNTVSVLLGNGDGTFQSPRQFQVGALLPEGTVTLPEVGTFRRGLAVADLNGDHNLDLVVTNPSSGDVSVLLGRGDGTFQPQRRFDATSSPNAVAVADFNGDGVPDLAVLATTGGTATLAILLGRGDGTFQPEQLWPTPLINVNSTDDLQAADLNGDGRFDLLLTGGASQQDYVYLGNGDGTFRNIGSVIGAGPSVVVADLNGDGIPDLVNANFYNSTVSYALGNGDGRFGPSQTVTVGEAPLAVAVADVGSQITLPDGSTALGPPDGVPDLIVADSGVTLGVFAGPPEVVVLPGVSEGGAFAGFGAPERIASGLLPQSLAVGDVNGDGTPDVAFVDRDGVHVVYGRAPVIAPNNTPATARNLGVVVHLVEPTLTLFPAQPDAYFSLTVPTEAARGSSDEVIDFSDNVQAAAGAGLTMAVLDSTGRVLGSGGNFRIRAAQGEVLLVRLSAARSADGSMGAGAYTLDIDVLPQLVSVVSEPLLGNLSGSAGTSSSLVLTFQGDRLDPLAAQDPSHYTVTWLGPDGIAGTADDRVVPLSAQSASIVYDPGANIDVATGLAYPTAVRQTVTLVFDSLLRPGSYLIRISPDVIAQSYNSDEATLLAAGGTAHPVVQAIDGSDAIAAGASVQIDHLVAGGGSGGFRVWSQGNPFLTQLHDDLSALLDAGLTQRSDDPTVTAALLQQITDRFLPALGSDGSGTPVVVVWLDPVAIDLRDTGAGKSYDVHYDLNSGTLSSNIPDAYVSVAGNVELLVLPAGGTAGNDSVTLALDSVSAASRGGAVVLRGDLATTVPLTDSIRAGIRTFDLIESSPQAVQEPAIIFDLAQHVSGRTTSEPLLYAGGDGSAVQLVSELTAPQARGAPLAPISNLVPMTAPAEIYLSPLPVSESPRVTIWEAVVGRVRDGFGLLLKFIRGYLAALPADAIQGAAPGAVPAPGPRAGVGKQDPTPPVPSSVEPIGGDADNLGISPAAPTPRDSVRAAEVGGSPGGGVKVALAYLRAAVLACGFSLPRKRRGAWRL